MRRYKSDPPRRSVRKKKSPRRNSPKEVQMRWLLHEERLRNPRAPKTKRPKRVSPLTMHRRLK